MELSQALLLEHSKKQCSKLVQWVGHDPDRFAALFERYTGQDVLLSRRAAWVLSYCVESHPELMKQHWKPLFKKLREKKLHDAIKRNAMRLMTFTVIPKRYQGEAMDTCFQYLSDPNEAVATKAFALTVLDRLAEDYPDIVGEIRQVIEEQIGRQSPAFRNHAGKWLKKWNQHSS